MEYQLIGMGKETVEHAHKIISSYYSNIEPMRDSEADWHQLIDHAFRGCDPHGVTLIFAIEAMNWDKNIDWLALAPSDLTLVPILTNHVMEHSFLHPGKFAFVLLCIAYLVVHIPSSELRWEEYARQLANETEILLDEFPKIVSTTLSVRLMTADAGCPEDITIDGLLDGIKKAHEFEDFKMLANCLALNLLFQLASMCNWLVFEPYEIFES